MKSQREVKQKSNSGRIIPEPWFEIVAPSNPDEKTKCDTCALKLCIGQMFTL